MDSKNPLIRYCANTAKIEVIAPLRWNQDASDSEPGRSTEQSDKGPTTIADTQRKTIRQLGTAFRAAKATSKVAGLARHHH